MTWPQLPHRRWHGLSCPTEDDMASAAPQEMTWPQLPHRRWHGLSCPTGDDMTSAAPQEMAWPQLPYRRWHDLSCPTRDGMTSAAPPEMAWPQLPHKRWHDLSCPTEDDNEAISVSIRTKLNVKYRCLLFYCVGRYISYHLFILISLRPWWRSASRYLQATICRS